jgi:hypothetical protein
MTPRYCGAEEVLVRAARRSGEEARAVRESAKGTPSDALLARAGDLARSQWFLWTWATLAAGERLGRAVLSGFSPPTPSPRAALIGMVTSDLYLGYAVLRERVRWAPRLVRSEDWELAHRRGAAAGHGGGARWNLDQSRTVRLDTP